MGIATTNKVERVLAVTGKQKYADTHFEHHQSVMHAGVLFALPALISQGLDKAFSTFDELKSGFYGLHHIVILSCFMVLCRIKNPEQLKKYPPGELGKLLGLDRVPEVGYFRKKLKQIIDQGKTDAFHTKLFQTWLREMPEMIFYIDGHVRVYHGKKANLPKRYVSRQKLCLSGTTEFWINDQWGKPLMVITGELNEGLKQAIELAIQEIKKELKAPEDKNAVRFTLVFDREAYEPSWFKKLWTEHKVAVITYRKNIADKWDEKMFTTTDTQLFNNNVTMQLCELGVKLNEQWFREIRKLSDNGHQTSILTTHPTLSLHQVASKMFARWTQENFFKYLIENFDFDKMIEYGTQTIDQKRIVPNPEYRKLTYRIKKLREKKSRLEAKVYRKMENNEDKTDKQLKKIMAYTAKWLEQISNYNKEIDTLLDQRTKHPSRITLAKMPDEQRYNKLNQEGKKFKNAIIMLAYRAETALYNIMTQFYKDAKSDGRMLLKEIFSSDADMIPDYKNKTLTIVVHSMSTPRANLAVGQLCEFLNGTDTVYPYSNLRLIFKSVAV